MHLDARGGHVEVVKALGSFTNVDENAAANTGWTPIHRAAKGGHVNSVRFLTSLANVDVHAVAKDGCALIHVPTRGGRVEVVKVLGIVSERRRQRSRERQLTVARRCTSLLKAIEIDAEHRTPNASDF